MAILLGKLMYVCRMKLQSKRIALHDLYSHTQFGRDLTTLCNGMALLSLFTVADVVGDRKLVWLGDGKGTCMIARKLQW